MTDFDSQVEQACELVMSEVLSPTGRESTKWWLARMGVTLSDCSMRPREFDDALVELFQPMGALIIEAKILSRLYRSHGARYDETDDLCFADEVNKARLLFGSGDAPR
ncbi:MAG: hypothetical protein JRN06_00235 [Nitrososphaerota archaeon]|nr:hypothetical protein [Nitrososphaerota archaeon]MDG7023720.1 hypothetical protein [Nitrososphaerota archaeon]